MRLLFLLMMVVLAGCAVSNDPHRREIRLLHKTRLKDDTTFVYTLPFERGGSYLVLQGYYGPFSHKNGVAVDFKMSPGTRIAAARRGVVVRAREDNHLGGWNREYRQYANYVVIEHEDGTRAGYWHLQQNGAMVNVGDTVTQGQVIGLSGSTGLSALPHLHFVVWANRDGRWQQLPTRFLTNKGPRYLKPLKRYRNTGRK